MKLFGGIEAGGTKFICAVGDSTGKLNEKIRIPTNYYAKWDNIKIKNQKLLVIRIS